MLRIRVVVFACLVSATLTSSASAQSNCSTLGQSLTVRDVMERHYLWYQFIPSLDPARFSSPEAYLDAIRYRPFDRGFSYIASREETEAYYSSSQFVGIGLSTRVDGGELRVLQVFADSPAAEAGLARGARIREINGQSVAQLIANNTLDQAWGAASPGVVVDVRFESRTGEAKRAQMVKRLVTIPTVSLTRVLDVDGRAVGYFELRNFVEPSFAAIDEAVAVLREARVSQIVLDLRYNGGGLVDVSTHLASLIGGAVVRGQVFGEMKHNDKNRSEDETIRFREVASPLELSRVIVVTTRSSASASELLINGLRPYLPVIVIGDATYGKPVGQYGFNFCDKTLVAVAFSIVNARGEGDYFDGIAADCVAGDDVERDLGDPLEASLAEALHYARTGACSAAATAGTLRQRAEPPFRLTGWRSLINAY
jgi:carboxyl-terminal processing protease